MIKIALLDTKQGNLVKVGDEGELNVVVHPHPPKEDDTDISPYVSDFLNSSDSNDFRVDGSTTNIDFFVNADPVSDLHIKTISVIIADAGASLNEYGNLTALTNGTQLIWQTQDIGEVYISSAIQTNLDFMRATACNPSFGTGQDAFKADLSGGGADAYLPVYDLSYIFGLQYGVKLRAGTKDKLIFRIRDNLSTGIDEHNAVAYGIKF